MARGDRGAEAKPVVLEAGAWTRVPDPPLSARERPVAAYVGGEAVFVGGYSGPPCPPNADCAVPEDACERDGAAYDPATNTWRRIADAPLAVSGWAPASVVGKHLYVTTGQTRLVWEYRELLARGAPSARRGPVQSGGRRRPAPPGVGQ